MSKITCVFAHPDDESFGPGGTIASLSSANDISLICVTDGDVAQTGQKSVRSAELQTASQILGINQVHNLEFPDGTLSNIVYHQVAEAIKARLDELQPDTLITFDHSGFSGHLDHIAVTSVLNWLFPKLSYLQRILYYCMKCDERERFSDYFVYMPEGRTRPEIHQVVDVSPWWETKVRAMQAHVSQLSDCQKYLSAISDLPKEEWFRVRSK